MAAMIADEGFRMEVLAEPEDIFGRRGYLALRKAIGSLTERGDAVDAITVAREAQSQGYEKANEIVGGLPAASGKYLSVLAQARLRRKATAIGRALLTGDADPEKALSGAAEAAISALSGSRQRVYGLQEAGAQAFRLARQGAPRIVRSGIPTLDDTLRIIGPGDLVIVGARPSIGKTAMAVNIARNTAAMDIGTMIASLEMAPEAMSLRVVAQEANLSYIRLASNELTAVEWERARLSLENVSRLPISIADASGATVSNIRAAALRYRAQLERRGLHLGVLLVDYLQIVTPPRQERNRDREVAAITTALKNLARSLGVVVIALSQLSRALESRQDKRPTLADLRESGAIEQDADAVVLLHRSSKVASTAELIVAKQRNGPVGTVRAVYHPEEMMFSETGDACESVWDET